MQRVAIARALVNDPDIILADEPTGALDSKTSVQIMELLKSISKDKLIIMVTHNPDLAKEYSTRIIKLLDGNMVSDSKPYEPEKKEELPDETDRRIFVFERASQFDLMAENHETYMWLSPVPQKLKDRYGLVEKNCPDNKKTYRDLLIYRKDYHLSELDRRFITELCRAKRQYI